jgi:acyl transferase domain-containing protein/acyl carrier protein
VKTNIGHLDAAAGIAGLIKVVLSMKHRMLPASLHFNSPNPQIRFEDTPFYVNTDLRSWDDTRGGPLRAGVSAFGVGGTNAHVILEEAPQRDPSLPVPGVYQVIPLSAKTPTALARSMDNLANYLKSNFDEELADVAYTLQVGRQRFPYRFAMVCSSREQAIEILERERDNAQRSSRPQEDGPPSVIFMFPGQGAQHAAMGRGLYKSEPVFRAAIDLCSKLLEPHLGLNLADILYGEDTSISNDEEQLTQTWLAQPSIFMVEYGLSQLWSSWGVIPTAIVGHSLGEYVAACLSGVMTLEDALRIVAIRGKLMQQTQKGAMLSIPLGFDSVGAILPDFADFEIAAINSTDQTVVAGSLSAITDLEGRFDTNGIPYLRLRTSHAFHCHLVESIIPEFLAELKCISLGSPKVPFLSCKTGEWIQSKDAQDPQYWVDQMRMPVKFANAVNCSSQYPNPILLEVGPGQGLRRLALRQTRSAIQESQSALKIMASLPASPLGHEDETILRSLCLLWEAGYDLEWEKLRDEKRRRVSLPTYPFERNRYWVEPHIESDTTFAESSVSTRSNMKSADVDTWFWTPSWRLLERPNRLTLRQSKGSTKVVFLDQNGLGELLAEKLAQSGDNIVFVKKGSSYQRHSSSLFEIDPKSRADYVKLLQSLVEQASNPVDLISLWLTEDYLESGPPELDEGEFYKAAVDRLLLLFQAALSQVRGNVGKIWIVTSNCERIESTDICIPEYGGIGALCRVSLQEADNKFICRQIDVRRLDHLADSDLIDQLVVEMSTDSDYMVLGHRGDRRWGKVFERSRLGLNAVPLTAEKNKKTYLITGGLGNVGCLIARHLASAGARVILIGKTSLPNRSDWMHLDPGVSGDIAQKISRVMKMEKDGLDLHVLHSEVTSISQMTLLIEHCLETFGAISGVIHAAGLTTGPTIFCPLTDVSRGVLDAQSSPKLGGLKVLAEVLKDKDVDFVLAMSSNASILGGLGSAAYAMANAEMDSFIGRMTVLDKRKRWMSVNWDHWPEETKRLKQYRTSLDTYAMSEAESLDVLARLMNHFHDGQIVVSSGDLSIRLQTWEHALLKSGRDTVAVEPSKNLRPSLRTVYMAPQNELQLQIERIWAELLGVDKVGVTDDFFELGGHSLLATRIIVRMREELNVNIPLITLFEGPTISQIANAILAINAAQLV